MTTSQKIVVLAALFGSASLGFGQQSKLAPDLDGRDPEASVNVIVQYKQLPQQRHIDAVLARGGRHLRTLNVVKGAVYSIPAKELADLAKDPDVAYVSPDRPVSAASNSFGQLQPDYKLQAVGASIAQQNGYQRQRHWSSHHRQRHHQQTGFSRRQFRAYNHDGERVWRQW